MSIDVNKLYGRMDDENDDALVRGVKESSRPDPPNPAADAEPEDDQPAK